MHALLTSNLPNQKSRAATTSYVVTDLEMTGLNASQDKVLSIGWVIIENQCIINGAAKHLYFKSDDANLQESAPIHKIRNIDLADGDDAKLILDMFLTALCNRALVLHCATLDLAFLNKIIKQHYNVGLVIPTIDTMQVERRRLEIQGILEPSSLTLSACRHRYNLPAYTAHNAAIDALATAELWLAQLAHTGCNDKTRLGDYL